MTITCAAAVVALTRLAAKRLALINPPWFSVEMDQNGARYFESQGFEVIYNGPADLPSDQQAIEARQVYDWVRVHTPQQAEAVFIGGNGFRSIGIIQALEEELGVPVLTASQVAFWHALRLSLSQVPITSYAGFSSVIYEPDRLPNYVVDFRLWHFCDKPTGAENVRFRGLTGSHGPTVRPTRLTQLGHRSLTGHAAQAGQPI